jgi:hypothetical protein
MGQAKAPEGKLVQLSAGGHHTCGVREDGAVLCWGAGQAGQKGIGQREQSVVPAGRFVEVAAGDAHTCAVTSDGYVRCWGAEAHGRTKPSLAFAASDEMAAPPEATAEEKPAEAPRGQRLLTPSTSHARESLTEGDTSVREH